MSAARFPLIFLPGLVCDRYVWEYQIAGLQDVAISTCVEWELEDSLEAMAQKVLRQAPARFSLAGHSMGGRVALEVYRAAPDRVERIALLNTGAAPRAAGQAGADEERGRYALLEIAQKSGMRAMAYEWVMPMVDAPRRTDAALIESIVAMFGRKTPEIFACQIRALLNRPDATGVLSRIRCPALLLSATGDAWSPPERHAEMSARIPNSRLVIIQNCGHMSTLEHPREVSGALRSWLVES